MESAAINAVKRNDNIAERGSLKRVPQFSYVRMTACIAIVLLHCVNSARVYRADTISPGQVTGSFAFVADLMWAVPCFLMVTGALLLDPERAVTPKKLFGKYVRRVATALVVFTLLFTLIKHDPASGTGIGAEFLDGLLRNHCMAYLWYLYLMIALYLLMPLLRLATARLTDGQLAGLTIALAVIAAVPLVYYAGVTADLHLIAWAIYPAYLFAGYLLYRHGMDARLAAAVLALTAVLMPLLTVKLSAVGIDPSGLTAYNSPLTALQSAAVFSLLLRIQKSDEGVVASIDRCSFGIYLIHMVFLRLAMSEMGFDPYAFGPFGFAGLSIIAFLLSYGLTYLLKKLRFIDFL